MILDRFIGEGTQCEKKEMLEKRKPKSWLKSVSAFANGEGGVLVFGVSDKDEVIGLSDYQTDSEVISEMIKSKMEPIPRLRLEHQLIDNKVIILVYVYPGTETPYYVVDSGNTQAFIRIGNESVLAAKTDLVNLILKGMNKSFDSYESDVKVLNISFSKLRSLYFTNTGQEILNSDMESFGLVNRDGFSTNAGLLIADEPAIRQSRIFCTRWNGLDKASGLVDALDDLEIEGSILSQLQESENFIRRNSKKMWKKDTSHRIELPDYPERAVQEVIVNAIIHRDYTLTGSEIHIDMYDDRCEIVSPGGMVDGSFIQDRDILNISSSRRNPTIADIFSRMKLMERREVV